MWEASAPHFIQNARYECLPIHLAIAGNHSEVVKVLLPYTMNPDADPYNPKEANEINIQSDIHKSSTLEIAVQTGNIEIVKMILPRIQNPCDLQVKSGVSSIHVAAREGHTDILKLLLTFTNSSRFNERAILDEITHHLNFSFFEVSW